MTLLALGAAPVTDRVVRNHFRQRTRCRRLREPKRDDSDDPAVKNYARPYEVAEASDVPDPRIYDVLRDLADAGYIETYEQDLLYARAVSPEEVLDDL